MNLSKKRTCAFLLVTICFLGMMQPAFSQKKHHHKFADSLLFKSNDTALTALVSKIESYTYTIDHTNFLIKKQIDITPIAIDLRDIGKRLESFKTRLEKKGDRMNLRSLNSATILLKEVAKKLTKYKTALADYSKELSESNAAVKKIIHDPALNTPVTDSILIEQLDDILTEGKTLDSVQLQTLGHVNLLLNHVSITLLQADDIISDMGYLSVSLKMGMWEKDEMPLLRANPLKYQQSFFEITQQTLQRSVKIISIYLTGKWNILALGLLMFIFITGWCLSNMYRIKKLETATTVLAPVHVLKHNVVAGCLMALFTYLPFLFANPPMSFLHCIELLRLMALSFLIIPFLTKQSKNIWLLLFIIWIYYALDDLLLDSAFAERWALLIAGILLIVICIKLIIDRKENFVQLEESPATKALLIFTLAQIILSVIFNVTGRVALAKIFGVSGIQCLMLAIALKIFSTMVLEAIYLQSEAYSKSRFSDFINFNEIQIRVKRILWIITLIIWTVSLIRNLTMYDEMMTMADSFFNQQRSIGNMIFTFKSVAVFIFIIWLSSAISTVINFFFGNESLQGTGKRKRFGSMMLLIRLTIWTLGFLIAVAAAGIPLDKLSFMLGALGVGIGFGLQTIVNNLVSGIIIAFERPIQVGDLIEIGNKTGTVKEIGVRSSKIKNADGADIIIPNGDLLSQHLINWTMQDTQKRVEFTISIPYAADIEMVKTLIQSRLKQNENILQSPAPAVVVQTFAGQAIEIKILCWVPDLTKAASVRSNVMLDIYAALHAAGVQLQLPL
ncbi:mechanosensitive channel MscK precursor [mine drainage metagenome]|uniref:Mechanosensitive channel MscK n=1 Tax=mine drainage metagenome TaxID=410659 RepID=A0A1J5SWZ8_9ZZZZ